MRGAAADQSGRRRRAGFVVAAPEIWVRSDHHHLAQVLYNLISNAIKHSPTGGTITLGAAPDGELVRISVQDQGAGIAAEDLGRIFVEFETLKSKTEGTGLGLALSRRLAELMDGDLSVTSEVGVGSIFTLTLPAATAVELSETGSAR